MAEQRAFVLLSGGIDSATCLYLAHQAYPWLQGHPSRVTGISVFYGQRHAKEINAASALCRRLGLEHVELDLSQIVPKTMLTDASRTIPTVSYDEIKGVSPTYVPFRNGLLLSAATSFIAGRQGQDAPKWREWALYFGAHAEDARNWAYPDCTPEFIGAMANAIYIGTYRQVRLHTPLEWLTKREIIKLGTEIGVPWETTWSCYAGGEIHCGICPTCRARRQGFIDAGVHDPTFYAAAAA